MSARRAALIAAAWVAVAIAQGAAAQPPASTVRLNQMGLETAGPKIAVAPNPSKAPLRWRLIDGRGRTVSQGLTRVVGDDAASGEHVHQVDFSSFSGAGEGYRLVAGEAQSRPFRIAARPLGRLKYDALAFFFHQRSGAPIEVRFAGDPKWARPAGHLPERVTCVRGDDMQKVKWAGCAYTLDATGGWYDAGDHGKYVVNGGISVWTLLNAYERAVARGTAAAFADGRAAIPENRNGVSDLLDEARWEMVFLMAMQAPDGAQAEAPVGPARQGVATTTRMIDASGMAHHKLASQRWTPLPSRPSDDRQTRYLYPPSTGATLNLAATAAQCARTWRTIDPAFSAQCLKAAERAYAAARRNPDVYAWNNFDGSGAYGDADLDDEFYWAAAELYVTTGQAGYLSALQAAKPSVHGDIGWGAVGGLGDVSLALAAPDRGLRQAARARLIALADTYLDQAGRQGYAIPYAPAAYPWGSNSNLLNRALVLGLAYDFTGKRAYRDAVVSAMDYVLGRNPLDQSYVTGYGARPMRNPHHRFWAQTLDPAYPPPPPGVLSGGPNNANMSDPIASKMRGTCKPQTCWADHVQAYALNEVAINWNAPLFWVAAFLDEPIR
jgi:endoglucanase